MEEREKQINPALLALIREWMKCRKTGKIVINFFKGGIAHINKEESVKLPN